MFVERHLGFQAQGVARAEAAGDDAKLLARFHDFVPDAFAGGDVAGNVNFKAVFAGVAGAGDQRVFQSANGAVREPIIFDGVEIGVGEFAKDIDRFGTLNGELGVGVAQIFDLAIEGLGVVANPVDVFFAGAGVDDQQIVVFTEAMNDDVVDKRAVGIEHCGILRLADGELRGVVHGDVLNGGERAAGIACPCECECRPCG